MENGARSEILKGGVHVGMMQRCREVALRGRGYVELSVRGDDCWVARQSPREPELGRVMRTRVCLW